MLQTKVAIIGAGPVGLLASLLLQQHKVDFLCLEKAFSLRAHPSAHWISARSKRILSQIPNLTQTMDSMQEPLELFSHYRYVESIGGQQFGSTDHFAPSLAEALKVGKSLFGQQPNHLSQSRFVELLFGFLEEKKRVMLSSQVTDVQKEGERWRIMGKQGKILCSADWVILCDGFTSGIRKKLGIQMRGGRSFYKLINIHFKSRALAQTILNTQSNAMLHFVYNDQLPCVLVNHSYQDGEFVLQIPNYEPFLNLLECYSPQDLIRSSLSAEFWSAIQADLEIVHVGRWKLQAKIASTMISDNSIFLAGDTAHTYTPAGGFGMNCGLQDVHQLVHTLLTLLGNPGADKKKNTHMYNGGRLAANHKYLAKSLQNYEATQKTAGQLGLPPSLTEYYFKAARIGALKFITPSPSFVEKARQLVMRQLFRPARVNPTLGLVFDNFDDSVERHSTHAQEIIDQGLKGNFHDVWVDRSVPDSKISALFGDLNHENILRRDLRGGQKIVRRDGIVLL